MKKITALLPMKKNSDRIKDKNFKLFFGKPLFEWILDTLLSIELIDQIVINTDAIDILTKHGITKNSKVLLRKRKKEICGDNVSMNIIIEDDLKNIESDFFLMTHSTNPLLTKETIYNALEFFIKQYELNEIDSLFSVNKIQTRFYDSEAKAINHDLSNLIPTQNINPWYEENSNLYIFSKSSFNKNKSRIGKKPLMFRTSLIESVDIDTKDDWSFAEVAYKYLNSK